MFLLYCIVWRPQQPSDSKTLPFDRPHTPTVAASDPVYDQVWGSVRACPVTLTLFVEKYAYSQLELLSLY